MTCPTTAENAELAPSQMGFSGLAVDKQLRVQDEMSFPIGRAI